MKNIKKYLYDDWNLSLIIFVFLVTPHSFNYFKTNPKTQNIKEKTYITTGHYYLPNMTIQQIDNLPNISKKQAKLIFKSKSRIKNYEDFIKIKGIGKKKIKVLKKYIQIKNNENSL